MIDVQCTCVVGDSLVDGRTVPAVTRSRVRTKGTFTRFAADRRVPGFRSFPYGSTACCDACEASTNRNGSVVAP